MYICLISHSGGNKPSGGPGGGGGAGKFNTVAMRPPSTGDRSLPNSWQGGRVKDDCKYTYHVYSALREHILKVGSCPNNDKSVQYFFVLFCVAFKLFSESLSCRENHKILLRIRPYSFVYFLCVGIPILKIVLSHAHKCVSSDVIL